MEAFISHLQCFELHSLELEFITPGRLTHVINTNIYLRQKMQLNFSLHKLIQFAIEFDKQHCFPMILFIDSKS